MIFFLAWLLGVWSGGVFVTFAYSVIAVAARPELIDEPVNHLVIAVLWPYTIGRALVRIWENR